MKDRQARVFIVDDHPAMRISLRKLLEYEKDLQVCGEAATVEEAFQGIVTSDPDVAIVDLILGRESGLELLKRLEEAGRWLPVLVLSMLPEILNAPLLLEKGAKGYLMKSESPDQILLALRCVLSGKTYLSPAMEAKLKGKDSKSS